MAGKGGTVQIPWYATGLRGDDLADALSEIAPTALHYGATAYSLTRSRDDKYKFLLTADFPEYEGFTNWWEGKEFQAFRTHYSGYYGISVIYNWADTLVSGTASYATN